LPAGEGAHHERAGGRGLGELADRRDEATIIAVGDLSDDQCQENHRHELREADQAKVQGAAGQRVKLPAHRDAQHVEPHVGEDPRAQQEGEGGVTEHQPRS
jgi:hypothetical protein